MGQRVGPAAANCQQARYGFTSASDLLLVVMLGVWRCGDRQAMPMPRFFLARAVCCGPVSAAAQEALLAGLPMNCRNSLRVDGLLRNSPNMVEVTMVTPGLWTPRVDMQ